jgi:hypothetical protein
MRRQGLHGAAALLVLLSSVAQAADAPDTAVRPARDFGGSGQRLECTAAGAQVLLIEALRSMRVAFIEGDLPLLSFVANNGAHYEYLLLSPAVVCRLEGSMSTAKGPTGHMVYTVTGGPLKNQPGSRAYDGPQTVTCISNGQQSLQERVNGLSVSWTLTGFSLLSTEADGQLAERPFGTGEACLIEPKGHELLPMDPNLP